MSDVENGHSLLENACELNTPADNARSYDAFAATMDISPEMLAIAGEKQLYRAVYEVDLTGDLAGIPRDYGAVISAGTFTHGHLGPEVLRSLLALARPGAPSAIGINKVHFAGQGFGPTFEAMEADGLSDAPSYAEVRMYDRDGHDHSGDVAIVARYRKAP